MPPPLSTTTNLTITNPLVLYRSLLATRRIEPSESQHRLAIHLQEIYHRLKDYEPSIDYAHRLSQISSAMDSASERPTHFKFLSPVREQKAAADSKALIRRLTSADAAKQSQSPKGLLINGNPGTGKSMLVDLLASSLPTQKKARWHFSAFMLDIFSRIERIRRMRSRKSSSNEDGQPGSGQSEAMILVARDLVERSPIIFLDEFQMPDRASAKILTSLLTIFFQLGGVLVATSNRMPQDLVNAAGVEIGPPPSGSASWVRLKAMLQGGQGTERKSIFGNNADFAEFLEVVKSRCETWDMSISRDWRRRELDAAREKKALKPKPSQEGSSSKEEDGDHYLPINYHLSTAPAPLSEFNLPPELQGHLLGQKSITMDWKPYALRVYARPLIISHTFNGTALCNFSSLCASNLGPADYISIASTFHTLILVDIPVLGDLQKNEARRFITLLDALYEAHCRLAVSAMTDPDQLFFPKSKPASGTSSMPIRQTMSPSSKQNSSSSSPSVTGKQQIDEFASTESVHQDATLADSYSDLYYDLAFPSRPNTSSTYEAPALSPSYTSTPLHSTHHTTAHGSARSVLADEDADFGPVYGAGRSDGASAVSKQTSHTRPLNFQDTSQFTGADERFAVARAASRLWEMTGARWWESRPLEEVQTWWRPMSKEGRGWEEPRMNVTTVVGKQQLKGIVENIERDEQCATTEKEFSQSATNPFRTRTDEPPKFGLMHAWSMVAWGRKSSTWGKGVDGLGERAKKKKQEKDSREPSKSGD
jgi:protein AFG1